MYSRIIYLLVISLYPLLSFSQYVFERDTAIYIEENGVRFSKPWTGGMNSVQYGAIDLDLDGEKDLVTFDRSGNKINPYLYKNGSYIFAPSYRSMFPTIHDWIVIDDYNCDGRNDIYTYSTGGFAIYKNTSITSLSFNIVDTLVRSNYGGPMPLNIYISSVDIPAITDVDNDGDLDVLTFSILGGFIEYHKNMAIELTGNCDTIVFSYAEGCWGKCYEGLNDYILNCQNCQCSPIINNNYAKQKHAGSTLLAIDIDNDNDKDLILGDMLYSNLNLLINGGDSDSAHIVIVDSIFPANLNNTSAVNIPLFPAAFYLDINHDGNNDLLVSPNNQNSSENFQSSWLYMNNGQNNSPDFNFIQKDFLQEEMIDLGEGAYPTFFDHNNDGLLDLIVGNYGYYNPSAHPQLNHQSSLALFENIGTTNEPRFELIERDWQGIGSMNLNTSVNIPALNLYPTFGDMDGDGDKDMILGDADGKIHYFINDGNTPANFTISQPNYYQIDVGYFATPQIIDVNRDGLNDLIIGEQLGTINYAPNTGTNSNAIFDTLIENFGGIDIEDTIISTGYSTPKLVDNGGVFELFSGSYTGAIYSFNNIDGNLNGNFSLTNLGAGEIWEGGKSSPAFADLNNDNLPELILGNYSGGIGYFSSDTSMINPIYDIEISEMSVFPNPATQEIQVISDQKGLLIINDVIGKVITSEKKIDKQHRIDISNLSKGFYIIKLGDATTKFFKQ